MLTLYGMSQGLFCTMFPPQKQNTKQEKTGEGENHLAAGSTRCAGDDFRARSRVVSQLSLMSRKQGSLRKQPTFREVAA